MTIAPPALAEDHPASLAVSLQGDAATLPVAGRRLGAWAFSCADRAPSTRGAPTPDSGYGRSAAWSRPTDGHGAGPRAAARPRVCSCSAVKSRPPRVRLTTCCPQARRGRTLAAVAHRERHGGRASAARRPHHPRRRRARRCYRACVVCGDARPGVALPPARLRGGVEGQGRRDTAGDAAVAEPRSASWCCRATRIWWTA